MTVSTAISEHPVPAHMIAAAARIVTDGEITRLGSHAYQVRDYTVTISDGVWTCTCPSAIRCKHMLAALHVHMES